MVQPRNLRVIFTRDVKALVRERFDFDKLPAQPASIPSWVGPPYPGLRSFTSKENPIFFGRNRETNSLMSLYRDGQEPFLVVVGASGTGKSSLVQAGLIPRIESGLIDGQTDWLCITLSPSDAECNPFIALSKQLVQKYLTHQSPEYIASQLSQQPAYISTLIDQLAELSGGMSRLCLFADQGELLFLAVDEITRNAFLSLMGYTSVDMRFRVISTIRIDLLQVCMKNDVFARLIQRPSALFPLGAPGPDALVKMIRGPAERAGLDLEDELVDAMIADAGNDSSGALPLLAFCLEGLYRNLRGRSRLELQDYIDAGRLRGVVATRIAELRGQLFTSFSINMQEYLDIIFREPFTLTPRVSHYVVNKHKRMWRSKAWIR